MLLEQGKSIKPNVYLTTLDIDVETEILQKELQPTSARTGQDTITQSWQEQIYLTLQQFKALPSRDLSGGPHVLGAPKEAQDMSLLGNCRTLVPQAGFGTEDSEDILKKSTTCSHFVKGT